MVMNIVPLNKNEISVVSGGNLWPLIRHYALESSMVSWYTGAGVVVGLCTEVVTVKVGILVGVLFYGLAEWGLPYALTSLELMWEDFKENLVVDKS